MEFTQYWVSGFGWENTIFQPKDFIKVEVLSENGKNGAICIATSENGQKHILRKLDTIEDAKSKELTGDEKLAIVKKLREETGWTMMTCKRALIESKWNYDNAKSWLIEYRKKPGIFFD